VKGGRKTKPLEILVIVGIAPAPALMIRQWLQQRRRRK